MFLLRRSLAFMSMSVACTFVVTTMLLHLRLTSVENESSLILYKVKVHSNLLLLDSLLPGRRAEPQDAQSPPKRIRSREAKADQQLRRQEVSENSASTNSKRISSLHLTHPDTNKSLNATSRRQVFEAQYPPYDVDRVRRQVDALRSRGPLTQGGMPYDVHNCPDDPPPEYPVSWPLASRILRDWKADSTEIPPRVYQGLCVFDWDTEQAKAEAYRRAEVPFVVTHHPDVLRTAERWNHPGYLSELIGPDKPQRNEHSATSKFMFWRLDDGVRLLKGWKPPTDVSKLTFDEWMDHAKKLESDLKDKVTEREHWYFRLNANTWLNTYLYEELPMFQPKSHPTFMVVDPKDHPGINCRFGSRGASAAAHYDESRNFILVLGGRRRYILSPPSECPNLELYTDGHPSSRHSKVDWSHPPGPDYPGPFGRAVGSEVVLQPGGKHSDLEDTGVRLLAMYHIHLTLFDDASIKDALYLPDMWFHYIVSLGMSPL